MREGDVEGEERGLESERGGCRGREGDVEGEERGMQRERGGEMDVFTLLCHWSSVRGTTPGQRNP